MSDLAKRIGALSDEQRRLLEALRRERQAQHLPYEPIQRRDISSPCPASFAQQQLWFVEQLEPGSPAYNIPAAIRLEGSLQLAVLHQSLRTIVGRHEALRTTFAVEDGRPLQVIAAHMALPFAVVDLRHIALSKRESAAMRLATAEARRPFELARGPLLRTTLLTLDDHTSILLLTLHHSISDAWSLGVLLDELAVLYQDFWARQPASLPELPIQYADFALWQHQWLQGSHFERLVTYWRAQLTGPLPELALTTDAPLPARPTTRGATQRFIGSGALAAALKTLGQQQRATLFMTLLAAFVTLLHGYTRQTDLLIGSPVANRNRPELKGLIGLFVNTLVLRADLAGEPTFEELLNRVRARVLDAYEHQELPFEKLVEVLQPNRDPRRTPLIQVVFAFEDQAVQTMHFPELRLTRLDIDNETSKIDLILFIAETADGLSGRFEYNADRFADATIRRLTGDFLAVLEHISARPNQRISEIALPYGPKPAALRDHADGRASPAADDYAASNLTKNQHLFWMGQKLQPDVPLYNSIISISIQGVVDVDRFKRAFAALVEQNTSLRTVIEDSDGIPRRRVLAAINAPVEYLDYSFAVDPARAYQDWLDQRRTRQFTLDQRLFDCVLIKLGAQAYIWYLAQHHINTDAWSAALIVRRVSALYEALDDDQSHVSAPHEPDFQTYIDFERAYRNSPAGIAAKQYWDRKLATQIEPITFYGRAPIKTTTNIERISLPITDDYNRKLRAIVTAPGIASLTTELTLLIIFLTSLCAYLYRISGNQRIAIGVPFHTRFSKKFTTTIGLFMETGPLHVTIPQGAAFLALLACVRTEVMTVLQHYPYAAPNPPYNRAYDVLLNYHNARFPTFANLPTHTRWIHSGHGNDSLNIQVEDFNATGQFMLGFDFHCDIFTEQQRQRAIQHFLNVLTAFLGDYTQPLDQIDLLTAAERQQLLATTDLPRTRAPRATIAARLEEQAARSPDAIALVFDRAAAAESAVRGAEYLTYAALNRRANQLAHYLRRCGAGPNTCVGVCVERSVAMLISLWAVLKAGAAYVPLDPTYPAERLAFMLQDSQVRVLITAYLQDRETGRPGDPESNSLLGSLPPCLETVVDLAADWPAISQECDGNPSPVATPDDLLYVIYTSGSTGVPKGAGVYQRGFLNLLDWYLTEFGISAADRVLLVTSFSFDLTQKNLFAPFIGGGQLYLLPGPYDPTVIRAIVETAQITLLNCTPSAFYPLVEQADCEARMASLRYVFLGGEPIAPTRLRAWIERSAQPAVIVNTYGPTECSDICCFYRLQEHDYLTDRPPAIGHAITDTQVFMLDRYRRLVPIGVAGELCVAGAGVGLGYLNRPALTAERFVPNPFAGDKVTRRQGDKEPGDAAEAQSPIGYRLSAIGYRLYRTGDLARYRPNGMIEFLGRIDHQVKIRGFRMEPGEIEAVLRQHPRIRDAVVTPHAASAGEQRLVAYVVPGARGQGSAVGEQRDENATVLIPDPRSLIPELRAFLQSKLPSYMIPAGFMVLPALPLTPNGKVDRQALPVPDYAPVPSSEALVAPRNADETQIAQIWADLLELPVAQLSVYANFFGLGGHSLLATQVLARIRAACAVEVPLQVLFEQPTIAGLARSIESARQSAQRPPLPPIRRAPRDQPLPLSYAQQRLWLLDQFEHGSAAYNSPGAARLRGTLDRSALSRALNEIVQRHEVLRTTFQTTAGGPVQVIVPALALARAVVDLAALPASERERQANRLAREEARRPFDLAHGPLLRATLLTLDADDALLLITMHHIVSDAWSIAVFIRQLMILYTAFVAGRPSPLGELPIQYADYAVWQRQWMQGEVLARQLAYWRKKLAGAPSMLNLPTDRQRSSTPDTRGAAHPFLLPSALLEGLRALGQQEEATLFMTLLAAFQTLLHAYSEQDDILVGTPVAGRGQTESEELIGFFVNTLVLRTDLAGNPSFREMLRRVRTVCLEAYANQDLPFEKLVEAVQPARNLGQTPFFQVWFVFQQGPPPVIEMPGLTVDLQEIDSGLARYDLRLGLQERAEGLAGTLGYRSEMLDPATIAGMVQHFAQLLNRVLAQPDVPLSTVVAAIAESRRAYRQRRAEDLAEGSRQTFQHIRQSRRSKRH
jgi:amino acid adenylation domain-containing protein